MEQRFQEENYWRQRWATKKTEWHLSSPHTALVEYIDLIAPRATPEINSSATPSTVFLPLCGKTLDIHWLRDAGYNVIGCELSDVAVRELFAEMEAEPKVYRETTSIGVEVEVWEAPQVKIYCSNFFDLGKLPVTAVFDRAALVALPADTRRNYAQRMIEITDAAPQLIVSFEHERNKAPPHSVPLDLVHEYYGAVYNVEPLAHRTTYSSIIENTYLLTQKII